MRNPIAKIAVAAVVIVAVGIGIHGISGGTPAFAEVVKSILEAHTAVFKVVMNAPDAPAITMDGQFMDPGLGRHVMRVGDAPGEEMVMILDYVNGKGLVLIPAQKMAMAIELTDRPDELEPGKINAFKALRDRIIAAQDDQEESVEYLGESQINGRKAIGYRMSDNSTETTIWADVDSLLPLQVEYAMTEAVGPPVTVTMMDIEFNVPLERAAFSTEIPEGYSARTIQADASTPTENDVVETLRISADATGGKFPADLTIASIAQLGQAHMESKGLQSSEEMDLNDPAFQEWMQFFQKINRSLKFVQDLPKEADWHYAGAEATFGDATTPVFWYRPQGSETYRVIYADLSVLDVAAAAVAAFEADSDR